MVFDKLIEQRIQNAINAGELDNLPGEGKPLPDDDFTNIPEALRMPYKILKNAGMVPPEIQLRSEINSVETTIRNEEKDTGIKQALLRLHCLYAKLEHYNNERATNLALQEQYFTRMINRFEKTSVSN